jgi:hypothetical protein
MQFKVKNPTVPMCQEVMRLACNLIHWTELFRKNLGYENRQEMKKAEDELKAFLKENMEKIPEPKTDEA